MIQTVSHPMFSTACGLLQFGLEEAAKEVENRWFSARESGSKVMIGLETFMLD